MGPTKAVMWSIALLVLAALDVHAQSYSAVPRWGQASAIVYNTLFIHGGKTDPSHQFTYSSSPNSNDLLTLDLSSPFSLSAPPWSYVSGSQNASSSQGPAVAFHTLTPYTTSQMLLFGGDAGFATIGTNADSAWLLDATNRADPVWTSENTGWASEPIRRVYHTAPSASGAVYLLGGQKGDKSQLGFLESYLFNAVGNSGSPAFIPLSDSSNGPAGLFGHASHVLPGGLLIVFGGFFSSSNAPSPLNVIYTLDTTSSSPSWIVQNASAGIIPTPRRGFASVLLENGKILIHGGADATLQTVYSDGALLDTTQNPMSWSPINSLSDGLGARVGHFAVPVQGRVLYGFGWGGNAPADAGLALYDPDSSTFESSYTPPATPASITTLPVSPTAPGGSYPTSGAGAGGTGAGSNPTSASSSKPSSGHDGGGSGNGNGKGGTDDAHDSPKPPVAGIIVGSVFGFLAFVALVGGGTYYALRRRERRAWMGVDANAPKDVEGRWRLMPSDEMWDADESPTQPGGVQMAGTGWHGQPRRGWGLLGLGALVADSKRSNGHQRLDMLADEDARQFDVDEVFNAEDEWDARNTRRRQGTGGSSLSLGAEATGKSLWSGVLNASVTSLRNVGVALGVGATGAAAAQLGRGKDVNPPEWWEKDELPLDPFSDFSAIEEKAEPTVDVVMRPRGGTYASSSEASNIYADPFSDVEAHRQDVEQPREEVRASLLNNAHDEGTASTLGGDAPSASSQTSLPRSVGVLGLARVVTTLSDAPTSESHDAPSSRTTISNSNTSTGPTTSTSSHAPSNGYTSSASLSSPTSPRTTSIIGAVSAPNAPMRRSDSWWSRFSRTSFRDRHSLHDPAHSARNGGDALIDFRDPNPAPRLGPIAESAHSSPQTAQDTSPDTARGTKRRRKSGSGYAASTRSSVKTDHTADSELIERLGGRMEVVQRALSLQSRRTGSPSTTGGSPVFPSDADKGGLSTVEAGGSESSHRKSWTESSADTQSFTVDSPTDINSGTFGRATTDVFNSIPKIPPRSNASNSESSALPLAGPRPPRRALTGAVAARVSAYERRISQDTIPHNGPRSPPADTKAYQKEREERRSGVGYGLVPKAPLFVANPDRRNPSGST